MPLHALATPGSAHSHTWYVTALITERNHYTRPTETPLCMHSIICTLSRTRTANVAQLKGMSERGGQCCTTKGCERERRERRETQPGNKRAHPPPPPPPHPPPSLPRERLAVGRHWGAAEVPQQAAQAAQAEHKLDAAGRRVLSASTTSRYEQCNVEGNDI